MTLAEWIDCGALKISAEEIAEFAAISGDRFDIHQDAAHARARGFRDQVVHGLLVAACSVGLVRQTMPEFAGGTVTQLDWRFLHPVIAGDALSVRCALGAPLKSACEAQARRRLNVEIRNQYCTRVQTGELLLETPLQPNASVSGSRGNR